MGTNYYLRKKKPRIVYDEVHLAKRSYGWHPLFQKSVDVCCLDDVRMAVEEGDCVIVDEDGDEFSYDEFIAKVIEPFDAERENGVVRKRHDGIGLSGVDVQDDGTEWTWAEFC